MRREVQIALLAIVTVILSYWGYNFISGKNLLSGDNEFFIIIDNAKDINTATPVLISGYQVGTVTSVQPLPENIKKLKLGFQVKKEYGIPINTVVEVRPDGPLGGKFLALIYEQNCDGTNCATPGATLQSQVLGLISSMVAPSDIEGHVDAVTQSIQTNINKLGAEGADTPLDNTVRNLASTMDNLAASTSRFSSLMSRSSKDMEVTLANMAVLTESLVNSNAKLSKILNNLGTLSDDLSKVSLSSTVKKTETTIEQATTSLKSVEGTMNQATATMKDLNNAISKMTSDQGSLGLLMSDKSLYTNLEGTSRNLDLLLQDIRLNPRRYFKLFGKKVPEYEVPEEDPAK